jgi:ABC-2 type transport system permease protein
MVASWVFGREYSDRTAKDLLALPVSRLNMVFAKFIVVLVWCLLLSAVMFAASLLTGLAVGISGWKEASLARSFYMFAGSAFLTLLLCTPVAFIASISRGYLLPIAFAILTLIITNFVAIGASGLMPYFPWGIPALFSGIAGSQSLPPAGPASYIILAATSILGFLGTATWWRFADQT